MKNNKRDMREILEVLAKINDEIREFRKLYNKRPTFIIISRELLKEILSTSYELFSQHKMIIVNDEPLEIYIIWI